MNSTFFGEDVMEGAGKMEKWVNTLAVVTGVSSGIGAAIAEKLVKAGINVVGLSRRLEKMKELADQLSEERGVLHPIECDLRNLEETLEAFQKILENFGPISILINNAAVLFPSNITDGSFEEFQEMFDVNVTAALLCTKESIKSMEAFGVDGHIINIGSIASQMVPNFDGFSVYCATKHAIAALTAVTRQELIDRGSRIKISSVSPGVVYTDLFNNFNGTTFQEIPGLYPENIADAVICILGTPSHVQIHDLIIRVAGEQL